MRKRCFLWQQKKVNFNKTDSQSANRKQTWKNFLKTAGEMFSNARATEEKDKNNDKVEKMIKKSQKNVL